MIESRATRYGKAELNETEHFELTARMAAAMVEKWGMVVAMPDGEDSSGRQKTRLMTPDELVDRAFETAELFLSMARNRGHLHTSPSFQDCDMETNPSRTSR